ncbi:O-antigen ligase family protein [Roseomonas sp. PWR1]|uniref:O-antigen ligase family protein n=1 Tax=Roseomonas nitratireducens TaxID=2820810 RepID=A0ABS4AM55_9PROT|nr:O-antigen ligase family protein [Neoroseomonas nitratireducens]MBP0462314.1 O-antigen ligase family protein [Neoroseomonas nitratireducens]
MKGAAAASIGAAAAAMQFGGALKSAPPLAALPFDVTLAAAMLLAMLLPLHALARDWRVAPSLALPLASCGALWLWLALAGAWSPSSTVLAAKLPEAVLLAPAMLAAGMMVAGDAALLRRCADAALAIGAFVAGAIAWGIATDRVVLGGLPGANPDLVRVQYQVAGLAIASAAGLAALRATEARGARRLPWVALNLALAAAALLPGGRAALAALALAVAAVPPILLWRRGRPGAALAWPALVAGGGLAGLAVLLADPTLAAGLRTVERIAEGDLAASGRAGLWGGALDLAGRALPWGLGPGGFAIAAGHGERRGLHPHNHALEALVEAGLPGFVLWLAAFGGGALVALRLAARAEAGRAARVAALVLPVALTTMVSTDLGNRMGWFALGLALGLGVEAAPRHVRRLRQARA